MKKIKLRTLCFGYGVNLMCTQVKLLKQATKTSIKQPVNDYTIVSFTGCYT